MSSGTPFRILVVCASNAARSPIAEAIINTRGFKRPRGRVVAVSAGTRPASQVNEYAVVTLQMHGIPWGRGTPQPVTALATQPFDLVLTLCDEARDACPALPGAKARAHWGLPDPAGHVAAATARAAFAATYEALVARVNALLRLPLEDLDAAALAAEAQAIHDRLAAPAPRSSARLRHNT